MEERQASYSDSVSYETSTVVDALELTKGAKGADPEF